MTPEELEAWGEDFLSAHNRWVKPVGLPNLFGRCQSDLRVPAAGAATGKPQQVEDSATSPSAYARYPDFDVHRLPPDRRQPPRGESTTRPGRAWRGHIACPDTYFSLSFLTRATIRLL